MLNWLGIRPSYSRPRVSDDNAFVEALFKTAKYRPEFPAGGVASLAEARQWGHGFVTWYNDEHRHSRIGYVVGPEQPVSPPDTQCLTPGTTLQKLQDLRS